MSVLLVMSELIIQAKIFNLWAQPNHHYCPPPLCYNDMTQWSYIAFMPARELQTAQFGPVVQKKKTLTYIARRKEQENYISKLHLWARLFKQTYRDLTM